MKTVFTRFTRVIALMFTVVCLSSCAYVGAIGFILAGGETIVAQYKIPKGNKVAVVVDDYYDLADVPEFITAVEKEAIRILVEEDISDVEFISHNTIRQQIFELDDRWHGTLEQEPIGITTFGKMIDADIVIYVNLKSFRLREVEAFYTPDAIFDVSVYDCATDNRLFPATIQQGDSFGSGIIGAGYTLQTTLDPRDLTAYGASAPERARNKLAAVSGLDLAQLFFRHARPQPGQRLY